MATKTGTRKTPRWFMETIFDFMRDYQREHKYPPKQREIAQGTGISLPTVNSYLKLMADGNLIVQHPYSARGTYIASEPNQFGRRLV